MTINREKYYGATGCSGGPTTGATGAMGYYTEAYKDKGASNLGIYNCRGSTGGSSPSVHSEGRAMDFGVPSVEAWGTAFADFLVANSKELGVMLVIFDNKVWGCGHADEGWRPYSGSSPHTDHLHVEMNRETAKKSAKEVKKLWTDIAGGKTKDDDKGDGKEKDTGGNEGGGDGNGGKTEEEDLTGMSSYKKRKELEEKIDKSGVKIEDADKENMTLEELESLANLDSSITSQQKTATDVASSGIALFGIAGVMYSVLLFFAYLFDTSNNFTEGSLVRVMTGGRLESVHDPDDAIKEGKTTKIAMKGAFKYSLIGILFSLILISGAFFGWAEALITFIMEKVNG